MSREAQALADANRFLAGFGPKPAGNPEALFDLARELKSAAADARGAANAIAAAPASLTFSGPAGVRFKASAESSRGAGDAAYAALMAASASAHRDGEKLQREQDEWTKGHAAAMEAVRAAKSALNAVINLIGKVL